MNDIYFCKHLDFVWLDLYMKIYKVENKQIKCWENKKEFYFYFVKSCLYKLN